MRLSKKIVAPVVCTIVGFGLGVGARNLALPTMAQAQTPPAEKKAGDEAKTIDMSVADAEKIKQAIDAIAIAESALVQSGRYVPAIRTANAYAVLHGGVDARAALEAGQGVDPVTFAGLYQGDAIDAVLTHLGRDTLGRLTYKGELVRMIPVQRMKELDALQAAILDVAAGGTGEIKDF